jgi:hypothetical protein
MSLAHIALAEGLIVRVSTAVTSTELLKSAPAIQLCAPLHTGAHYHPLLASRVGRSDSASPSPARRDEPHTALPGPAAPAQAVDPPEVCLLGDLPAGFNMIDKHTPSVMWHALMRSILN